MFQTRPSDQICRAGLVSTTIAAAMICSFVSQPSVADQGGIGFWLPGTFGSLAATPLQPGLSWSTLYLHSFVSGGGDVASSRAIRFHPGRVANFSVNLVVQL